MRGNGRQVALPSADPLMRIIEEVETPGFVFSEGVVRKTLSRLRKMTDEAQAHLLFAVKALCLSDCLSMMDSFLDGFSVSSPFELQLAESHRSSGNSLHFHSPGLSARDFQLIRELSDYIVFNSMPQWNRFRDSCNSGISCGIRVNPQLSFLKSEKYDPCRLNSKLGIPLNNLIKSPLFCEEFQGIQGLHFHSNCESSDPLELLTTVRHLDVHLSPLLNRVEWINFGGGYLFDDLLTRVFFYEAVRILKDRYGLQVFIEPGAALVRSAASLVSSVVDIFESDGKQIAVLDTTVNHMPEVFEFQYSPSIIGTTKTGAHEFILAGCSCLAGDIFGEYKFEEKLEIGSRVIFANMGAYTTVKWHTFNGINLPSIYALTESGELVLKRQFTYEDFLSRSGVESNVPV